MVQESHVASGVILNRRMIAAALFWKKNKPKGHPPKGHWEKMKIQVGYEYSSENRVKF